MKHDAWENEMLETFERREEEAAKTADQVKKPVKSKAGSRTVFVGIRRTLLALLTIMILTASICGFVGVASAHGYLAVVLFFASIIGLGASFLLLYAQGITNVMPKESQGEVNE